MVSDGYLLAIDLGTTTARAVLFDLRGLPVAEAYREPAVYHPQPSWAEIDAEERWQSVVVVIREALQRSGIAPGRILGIGISGLLHALIPIGAAGVPLARAMLWMDQRCAPQAEWMMREHGALLEQSLGSAHMGTTPSAPKLRWLHEHDPQLIARTWQFLASKDWVRYKLTGTLATDPSDARGMGLYDPQRQGWALPVLELVGVPADKMPPIRASAEVVGTVTAEAAALTGLVAGTPVVTGGGDTLCTRIGANTEHTGRTCLYLGTAAWIATHGRRPGAFGVTATTGAAFKWWAEVVGLSNPDDPARAYPALLAEAEGVPPGARGALFLPHLSGERGPIPDPLAKGTFFGLTLAHGRAELARAVLEGCALHLRAILEAMDTPATAEMVVAGGGAKSALWRRIISDVTGSTLLVPRVLEAGALGAAALAAVGVGLWPDVPAAAEALVRYTERHIPDAAQHTFYERIYRVYVELEERVSPLYAALPVAPLS